MFIPISVVFWFKYMFFFQSGLVDLETKVKNVFLQYMQQRAYQ